MWQLNKIEARNLCAFRELEYTLKQGVTTLVFGDNRDNESQRSNGSGKSALIECIAIGITGSPLRKINNEEIINDDAQECFIGLWFSNDSSDEVFIVERELFRKSASVVTCQIKRAGKVVKTNEAVQPSVDAYNKYILDKLGITRDELFNNFILSKYKYQNFLSSSDKDKKDIINRFSNGILVDQAIEMIDNDITPIQSHVKEIELELAGIDGRIDMLDEQIRQEENSREEKNRTKAEKIASIEKTIAEKRSLMREKKDAVSTLTKLTDTLDQIDGKVQRLENFECGLDDCLTQLNTLLVPVVTDKLTDWSSVILLKKKEIDNSQVEIKKWETIIGQATHKVAVATKDCFLTEKEYEIFSQESSEKWDEHKSEIKLLEQKVGELNRRDEELKKKKRSISTAIEVLSNKLSGTVKCPACQHVFLVSDADFNAETARGELDAQKEEMGIVGTQLLDCEIGVENAEMCMTHHRNELRSLDGNKSQWDEKLVKVKRAVQSAEYEITGYKFNLDRVVNFIAERQKEIDEIHRKVFDEVFGIIDEANRSNERKKDTLKEDIKAAECSIETLNDTIAELNHSTSTELVVNLKESLKSYRKKSGEILIKKGAVESNLLRLREQEERFVQFKTFLANTKIEALSKITNEFLEDIGSDIRINFSGYTVLKSGKVREKISISLIRDGIDCGSFGKFSAGEAARVNLATILAMQKLVNGNCDLDKGLDLLVLDEILEAVDEEGLASMFYALNRLGNTALVVSHGNIAESYEHKLLICKENGESRIEH